MKHLGSALTKRQTRDDLDSEELCLRQLLNYSESTKQVNLNPALLWATTGVLRDLKSPGFRSMLVEHARSTVRFVETGFWSAVKMHVKSRGHLKGPLPRGWRWHA